MVHELKIFPKYFHSVVLGEKPFEVRRNDRHYKVGDYISLREYIIESNTYTGSKCLCRITYVLDDSNFCKEGYVILGIEKVFHSFVSN